MERILAEIESLYAVYLVGFDHVKPPGCLRLRFGGIRQVGYEFEFPPSESFEALFEDYAAYMVTEEVFFLDDPSAVGKWPGPRLQMYTRSRFLDYLRAARLFEGTYPGSPPMRHYEIPCLDHLVHVACSGEVTIRRAPPFPAADEAPDQNA